MPYWFDFTRPWSQGCVNLVSHVVKRANTERKILVAEASESTDVRFTISRMLDAVRRLDTEPNLTSVLNTLTELVAAEAGRVALFVVRDSQIPWVAVSWIRTRSW